MEEKIKKIITEIFLEGHRIDPKIFNLKLNETIKIYTEKIKKLNVKE
jgi:hypothetical protein